MEASASMGSPKFASIASYSYNRFNQLTAQTVNSQNCAYAYNADGIRTAKAIGSTVNRHNDNIILSW